MSQTLLSSEWLKQLFDPYAVLGISVTATEHQILKRYHALAKQLHPDRFAKSHSTDKELATAVFTCLINPAYERIKQTNSRADTIAKLRLEARVLKLSKASLQTSLAQQLIEMSAVEADNFYEQAIATLAETQYKSLTASYQVIQQLNELNSVYFCLLSGTLVQKHPITIVPTSNAESPELTFSEENVKPVVTTYAQRHYNRGVQYAKQANWKLAVQELRDAIKLEPNNSDYLALLGFVHFKQNFIGMAKVYLRQALRLNPQQPLAVKYASLLKLELTKTTNPKSIAKATSIAALLGWLSAKQGLGVRG